MDALIARLVILLDLLWDRTKDHTGLWALISEVVEEMRLASSSPPTQQPS